jgi:hypothetical protein
MTQYAAFGMIVAQPAVLLKVSAWIETAEEIPSLDVPTRISRSAELVPPSTSRASVQTTKHLLVT